MLEVVSLEAGYAGVQVLWGISFKVRAGELVALIGPNGAGKSTALHAVAGLVRPVSGAIRFRGAPLAGRPADAIARDGIRLVTEQSNLFLGMTVLENLRLGAAAASRDVERQLERVFDLFPALAGRRRQLAGTLSGGERRMLGLGRGLMGKPKLLLVDEPSLGLAPRPASAVYEALAALNRDGLAILLVEQNVAAGLEVASRGYVVEGGRVALAGSSAELLGNPHVRRCYLGLS